MRKNHGGHGENEVSWKLLGATVTGTSHEKTGTPCQDAHRIEITNTGVVLIAFADGAGSASLAEIGAQAAVETAMESLQTAIKDVSGWEDCLREAFAAAQQKILCEADIQGEDIREFACTLTLVVSDGELTTGGSVGDGAVILGIGDKFIPFLMPERGEYLNETGFLHDAERGNIALQSYQGEISGIAAFTDGLQMLALKLPEAEPHAGFFVPLFRFARHENASEDELRQFLQSPRVVERTDDDLTLILAVRESKTD